MGWFMLFSSQELIMAWSLEVPQERPEGRTANGRPEGGRPSPGSEQLHLWERVGMQPEEEVTEELQRALSVGEPTD